MPFHQRPLPAVQPGALGAALLWGAVELLALWRARLAGRARTRR